LGSSIAVLAPDGRLMSSELFWSRSRLLRFRRLAIESRFLARRWFFRDRGHHACLLCPPPDRAGYGDFAMDDVNAALDHLRTGNARHRIVLKK
jgi:hypothetical protein